MIFNRQSVTLVCVVMATVSDAFDVCSNTTVAALSVQEALFATVHCTYSVRSLVYSSQRDIDLSVASCLNRVLALDRVAAPIATSQCRLCYQVLITDLLSLTAGRMVSGVFVPTTSNLSASCDSLSSLPGREACLKHPQMVPLLLEFHKCADYSILYPAGGDLPTRRRWYRAGILPATLRLGLISSSQLPPSLVQITNLVNNPPTPSLVVNLHLCYLTFVADIAEDADKVAAASREDCLSPHPGSKCFSDSRISDAMGRFERCSGFAIDQVPLGCSNSTMVTKVLENYDVLATVIPLVQSNYTDDLTLFFDVLTTNLTAYTTADCALCFRELAMDIQANILRHQADTTFNVFDSFLSMCEDPHSLSCMGLVGLDALLNFQQCSGTPLDTDQLVTTTTAMPQEVENIPESIPEIQSGILESASPSSILVALTVFVAFAF